MFRECQTGRTTSSVPLPSQCFTGHPSSSRQGQGKLQKERQNSLQFSEIVHQDLDPTDGSSSRKWRRVQAFYRSTCIERDHTRLVGSNECKLHQAYPSELSSTEIDTNTLCRRHCQLLLQLQRAPRLQLHIIRTCYFQHFVCNDEP